MPTLREDLPLTPKNLQSLHAAAIPLLYASLAALHVGRSTHDLAAAIIYSVLAIEHILTKPGPSDLKHDDDEEAAPVEGDDDQAYTPGRAFTGANDHTRSRRSVASMDGLSAGILAGLAAVDTGELFQLTTVRPASGAGDVDPGSSACTGSASSSDTPTPPPAGAAPE